ncbi:MAG: glycosyltransferase [Magnetococcales bacterium]|nr:glycosyltransferase [Magnetococcales bacterium]
MHPVEYDASVVIPSYNNRLLLLECLKSLEGQSWPVDRFEVIVVLDGSTDGSKEALLSLKTGYSLTVHTQENRGRASALNAGVARAGGRMLIFTDADIRASTTFIEAHLNALTRADASIGPIPLDPDVVSDFVTDPVAEWGKSIQDRMERTSGPTRCTDIFGANIALKTDLFLAIGGYREDLRRAEDYALGRALISHGVDIVHAPEAVVYQTFDKTISELFYDTQQDGFYALLFVMEAQEQAETLILKRWHSVTTAKRLLRRVIIPRNLMGEGIVLLSGTILEGARRLGWRHGFWRSLSGVIRDALFFRGVRDALSEHPSRPDTLSELRKGLLL